MAKTSLIVKNQRRRETVLQYAERRAELLALIKHPDATEEDRERAYLKLRKMPRDASAVRVRRRCHLTGRSRGNYRKFGMCRNMFRDLSLLGEIPGVRKASW
ncbi:30S ribosomal protein S14 [Engelhardtia mirabilis]|uniref:Small ribosomal subunit protein uS14 n=1 Tax=Engelhardtia mirabilis TaxID=2528011 RepID=A0A518BNX0_9BACT|nr:30S ribosomal protein S14 [Planctomycetes bacterium Pla133]QDV02994.1 30S ribosomal protein S14 [Planctomycetes bacterium Pla86]